MGMDPTTTYAAKVAIDTAKEIAKPSIKVLSKNLADIVDGITCPGAFWGQNKRLLLEVEQKRLKEDLENLENFWKNNDIRAGKHTAFPPGDCQG